MKIAIVGIGYVGLSNAILLSQNNSVTLLDVDQSKVDLINKNQSPFIEEMVSDYLANKDLDICATIDTTDAFANKDFIVIATPTNYDSDANKFDTSIVDSVIKEAFLINPEATIIIKSTVPLGYTDKISLELQTTNIIFSPEFLREGNALQDNLYPSRIIVGGNSTAAKKFGEILKDLSLKAEENIPLELMGSEEAEAVKLFANTYLAMRIAYYNELDSYCELKGLNTESVID